MGYSSFANFSNHHLSSLVFDECQLQWPGLIKQLFQLLLRHKRHKHNIAVYCPQPHYAIPCHTMLYHAIPCHTMPYHAIPCHTQMCEFSPCSSWQHLCHRLCLNGDQPQPVSARTDWKLVCQNKLIMCHFNVIFICHILASPKDCLKFKGSLAIVTLIYTSWWVSLAFSAPYLKTEPDSFLPSYLLQPQRHK